LLTVVVLTLNLVYAGQTRAQDRAQVGWAAMTACYTPLWVGARKRILAKQGLSVEPIFFGAGPPAMQALVAGDLDIASPPRPMW
jgi:ABC-type nitrate/sulfonate/bicarbonate transport system substrate-binding protein